MSVMSDSNPNMTRMAQRVRDGLCPVNDSPKNRMAFYHGTSGSDPTASTSDDEAFLRRARRYATDAPFYKRQVGHTKRIWAKSLYVWLQQFRLYNQSAFCVEDFDAPAGRRNVGNPLKTGGWSCEQASVYRGRRRCKMQRLMSQRLHAPQSAISRQSR